MSYTSWTKNDASSSRNPFVPNTLSLHQWNIRKLYAFQIFYGVKKECIRNKWVTVTKVIVGAKFKKWVRSKWLEASVTHFWNSQCVRDRKKILFNSFSDRWTFYRPNNSKTIYHDDTIFWPFREDEFSQNVEIFAYELIGENCWH